MADTLDPENAAFWLPSSFLTDDDDIKLPNKNRNNNSSDDFLFGSSLDSPVSSTETELGDGSNNDDEFVAELTRHLARSSLHDSFNDKTWNNISTSPQSTLTGFGPFTTRSGFSSNGSPNGPSPRVPSPPLTPPAKNDAAWELLYEAASQVARLKMNALAAEINNHHRYNNHNHHLHHHQQNRGLLGVPLSSKPLHHSHTSLYDFPQYEQAKRQGNGTHYCNNHQHQNQQRSCNGGPLGLLNTSWPPLRPNPHHNHNHNHLHPRQPSSGPGMRSIFLNGPGTGPSIKRQSTGTGVFLPRRAGAGTTTQQQPEPRKRPNGCASMWLPGRVIDALNMEVEEVNPNGLNANPRVRFGSGMLTEQEMIMARRNAIMEQQRRSLMRNDEIRLPSDWTY